MKENERRQSFEAEMKIEKQFLKASKNFQPSALINFDKFSFLIDWDSFNRGVVSVVLLGGIQID